MSTKPSIRNFVRDLVAIHGSQRAVAKLLGVSESRLGKLVHKDRQRLSVYHCLVLAKVGMLEADVVLRCAGKTKEADLIKELWGPPTEVPDDMRAFLQRWRAIPVKYRTMLQPGLADEG